MTPESNPSALHLRCTKPGKLDVYQRYKKIAGIEDNPSLAAFEELVTRTSLYDLVEYSHKYSKRGSAYEISAQRFSLFKYAFNLWIDLPFLHAGLRAFKKITAGHPAALRVSSLFRMPCVGLCRKEVCFAAIGVALSPIFEESTLKVYVCYRPDPNDEYPVILRNALTLDGVTTTTQYTQMSLRGALVTKVLDGLPESLKDSDSISRIFVQPDKFHFELRCTDVEAICRMVHEIVGVVPGLTDRLFDMASSGFRVIIVSFDRSHSRDGGLTEFTVYFRPVPS
jgi:hypothetical protein